MSDAHARALDRINETFAKRIPYNAWLGLEAIDHGPGRVVIRLPYHPRLVGNPVTGVLHGGVITATMDAAAGASVFMALDTPLRIATLDLRIDYLAPASPERDVLCDVVCYRITKQVAFVRGQAHHDDPSDPIASCAGTFMLFRDTPSELLLRDPT